MRPAFNNIEKDFTVSGIKSHGGYKYVLLVGFSGQAIIKRFEDVTNPSTIKFVYKEEETTIDTFWANYTSYTYEWISGLKND